MPNQFLKRKISYFYKQATKTIMAANVLSPEVIKQKLLQVTSLNNDNIEAFTDDFMDSWEDTRRHLNKIIEYINKLSQNVHTVQQNQNQIEEQIKKLEPYLALNDKTLYWTPLMSLVESKKLILLK